MRIHPEPGRHKLGFQIQGIQLLLYLSGLLFDLLLGVIVDVWHHVVIMKLHCRKSQLRKFFVLFIGRDLRPHRRSVRVGS